MLDGVDVGLRVVEVWGNGGDELGASVSEELLEDGQRLGSTALQLKQLITVLLAQRRVDGVVQTSRLEGDADGDQGEHLVVFLFECVRMKRPQQVQKDNGIAMRVWAPVHADGLTRIFGYKRKNGTDLGDRVVLGALLELLGPRNVDEDVAEHADGVGVAAHHHVGKPNIVVGREVGSHDTGEHGLLVELDVVEGLEGEAEVAEKAVDAQQADDGEVAEHAVEALCPVLASDCHGVLIATSSSQLLQDVGPLDQGVEHVEDAVAAPRVGVLAQSLDLLLVVGLSRDSHTVGGEGVELVDKLVDNIPSPVVLCLQVSLAFLVRDRVGAWVWGRLLTDGGSRSTGPSELRMKWKRLQ